MAGSIFTSRRDPGGWPREPGPRAEPDGRRNGNGPAPAVRIAYDAIAGAYDAQVARSSWVRDRLWQRLDALFAPGARVLDATAGTGADALHLAARGVAVTACDLSPAMLEALAAKAPAIATRVADCARLAAAFPAARFDGVLSTFAGLNTVADLAGFAAGAAGLLEPGGVLFVHLLNRLPLAALVRRFRSGGWQAGAAGVAAAWRGCRLVTIGGVPVPHRLHSPRRLYREVFARDFALLRVSGQGVLRPVDDPAAVEGPGSRRRRGRDRWEERLGAWPSSRGLGTFFALEMRRRGGSAARSAARSSAPAGRRPMETARR
jgi:SAM-dependent methyltransferase